MHKIKGEADALNISILAELAHKFETDALKIKQQDQIRGQDFVPVTVTLEKMISYTESLSSLHARINADTSDSSSSNHLTQVTHQIPEDKWKHLYDLTKSVSKRQNKLVELSTSGLNDYQFTDSIVDYINTLSTQLIRNSIVHGIESPQERVSLQKNETGLINLTLSKRKDNQLHIDFKDDGAGIDTNLIREKAVELNIITAEKAELMASHEIISLLFHSGFSTAEGADKDHGHGIGMALVKEKTQQLNGKISLIIRTIITEAHNKEKYELVATAVNGQDAIDNYLKFTPQIVTMDLTMPGVDGIECIDRLMQINPDIQIVVVSALSDEATGIQALRKGASGFVTKPFTEQEICEAIDIIAEDIKHG